jgi:hypothetical protein
MLFCNHLAHLPWEIVYGYTPDISSLAEVDFYDPMWYYEPGDFPEPKRKLGRWLGETTQVQFNLHWNQIK